MRSSNFCSLAFFIGLSSLLSGCCCSVPRIQGGGCCSQATNCCPGLLHGEFANRIRDAIAGGCCSGCGEVYCDEQINEPPICDPCCGNGEFSGANCGPCRPLLQRLCGLWGPSYHASCDGCDSCGSGICGTDQYTTPHTGSGYCPSCRDGVAGNPMAHEHRHIHQVPATSPSSTTRSSPEPVDPAPSSTTSPRLEPIPDPQSDAPIKSTPTRAQRPTNVRQTSSRTIHVPATQAKHTVSQPARR